jgi:hypothetical protein
MLIEKVINPFIKLTSSFQFLRFGLASCDDLQTGLIKLFANLSPDAASGEFEELVSSL